MLPAEYPRHRRIPSTLCPCRAWSGRFWRPFFRRGEAAIHEALIPADLPAIVELGEERSPQRPQDALETPPGVSARPAALGSTLLTRQMRPNPLPLCVGERSPCHALTLRAPPPQSQVLK